MTLVTSPYICNQDLALALLTKMTPLMGVLFLYFCKTFQVYLLHLGIGFMFNIYD